MNPLSDGKLLAGSAHKRHFRPTLHHPRPRAFQPGSLALRSLPVGTAYAVWTGIGAVGTAAMGVLFMGDSSSPARLACMAATAGGVAGLKLVSD